MGRFKDLWASGKFTVLQGDEWDQCQREQALHQFEQVSPELAVPEKTRAIVDAIKARRGQETGRWLRDMAPKPARDEATVAATRAKVNAFEQTVAWIDTLFKEFASLAYEFNKTAAGSDLLISYTHPVTIDNPADDLETKTYQGRLTTRQWALIIRGTDKQVSVLLLPSAALLAFTIGKGADCVYQPFTEVLQSIDTGTWAIGGVPIQLTAVPHLAKELLGDLIRVSSGVMSESELFSRSMEPPKLGENLAIGYKQQQPPPAAIAPTRPDDLETMSMHDACDVVDGIIDRELRRLYGESSSQPSSTDGADATRQQISAVEEFRVKMLGAFEHYTELTQSFSSPLPLTPTTVELQH
jgi:hypothetical protein